MQIIFNIQKTCCWAIIILLTFDYIQAATPLYHLQNRASSSSPEFEQTVESSSSNLLLKNTHHHRAMRQHIIKKSDSTVILEQSPTFSPHGRASSENLDTKSPNVKNTLTNQQTEPTSNDQTACTIHKTSKLHEVIDRVCEMCHDMYSYQNPNMRSECR